MAVCRLHTLMMDDDVREVWLHVSHKIERKNTGFECFEIDICLQLPDYFIPSCYLAMPSRIPPRMLLLSPEQFKRPKAIQASKGNSSVQGQFRCSKAIQVYFPLSSSFDLSTC